MLSTLAVQTAFFLWSPSAAAQAAGVWHLEQEAAVAVLGLAWHNALGMLGLVQHLHQRMLCLILLQVAILVICHDAHCGTISASSCVPCPGCSVHVAVLPQSVMVVLAYSMAAVMRAACASGSNSVDSCPAVM